ncbi:hypothetical protein FSP39_007356, partial [Pinctada imbricata]
RYHIVFLIMLIHGIGILMPWNMLINAKSYFEDYKLTEPNVEPDQEDKYIKDLRSKFMFYLGIFSQVPNFVMSGVNTFCQCGGQASPVRIIISICIMVLVFIATVILAMVDSTTWVAEFFWITMMTAVVLNMATGVYQNSTFGLAAILPMKYTNAIVLGNNLSGVFVAVLNIICLIAAPDPRTQAIYYFVVAIVVLLLAFDAYFLLPLMLLVISKSKDPRCFRGVKSLPVTYTNSGNAWMTAEIFQNWLRDFNRDMARQKRKILLFIDNCSAHPKGSADRLANIKMEFLPPNTTSIIQSVIQGIIRNLKFYYRSEVIQRIIGNIDNTEMTANKLARKLTLLDAVHLLRRAWQCVKESTVSSYRTAGFVAPEQQEHCEDEDKDVPPVPSGLDAESFSTFVSHDDDLPCFASRSDEEICAEIRETATDVDSEDEDDFTPLELPVSATEAHATIETLHKFLGQKQSDDFDQLYKLEDTCERLIDTSRKRMKITKFI